MMVAAATYNDYSPAADSSLEASDGLKRLNSPLPYVFGGLALMLALIAVALIILTCSHRKNDQSVDEEKNPGKQVRCSEADCNKPRIVVIMAGDEVPTYLARPVVASSACQQAEEQTT